jgi:glycosyltransferase 2 family protein
LIAASKLAIVGKCVKILRSFRNYRTHRRLLATVLLLAFAFQFNVIVINKVYTLALGINVAFSLLVVIIPLIYLTEALPISINGLGVRESAFAFFFVMNGLTVEEGIAVSLLIVAERYLLGILGGSLLLASVISSRTRPVAAAADSRAPAPGP